MQFLANFNIWGLLYSALLPIRAKFRVLEQITVYAYVPNFVSIGLFYRRLAVKTPNFCHFLVRHFLVSPVGGSLRKLNAGAQLQTFSYPMTSKLFLYSNSFMAKSYAKTPSFKSVTDTQTNKQETQHL